MIEALELQKAETPIKRGLRFFILGLSLSACSLTVTRPVQEMSDTSAAIRAAREVQADTLAPELYRQANEVWIRAKKEYRYKNYEKAHELTLKARVLAERSEFEALLNNGRRRAEYDAPDPLSSQSLNQNTQSTDPYKSQNEPVMGPNTPPPVPPATMQTGTSGAASGFPVGMGGMGNPNFGAPGMNSFPQATDPSMMGAPGGTVPVTVPPASIGP